MHGLRCKYIQDDIGRKKVGYTDFVLWPLPRSCLRAWQWTLGTLELYRLGKHGATRPVRLITSSLWVFKPSPFLSPFLGAPRGPTVTKSILSPSGATVSPGFTLRPWIGA